MYEQDNPVIAAYMRDSAEGFARGATFALLSIRQPLFSLSRQMDEVEREGPEAACLFGSKRKGFAYLLGNADRLHASLRGASLTDALTLLCEVPSLGIPKAGFVAQLMGFDIGCLDSRNLARFGLSRPHCYRLDDVGPTTQAKRIARYVAEFGGRAREFWNDWCADLAASDPERWASADAVSREHVTCIVPETFIPF